MFAATVLARCGLYIDADISVAALISGASRISHPPCQLMGRARFKGSGGIKHFRAIQNNTHLPTPNPLFIRYPLSVAYG